MDLEVQEFKQKVDVVINVFGKTYQTIVTLKTLLKHSGHLIDKIYFIEELQQPEPLDFEFIKKSVGYENIIHFKPKNFFWVNGIERSKILSSIDYRYSIRYEYGIDKSDKKFVFITHNDVLFESDVIKEYLLMIGDTAGVGGIGQCWNCPLFYEEKCNPEIYDKLTLSSDEVKKIVYKHPTTRTFTQCKKSIDDGFIFPMPECRLNEISCLLNTEIYKKEVLPFGDVSPFGSYEVNKYGESVDLGYRFFIDMHKKGYKFTHSALDKFYKHGYFSEIYSGRKTGGHPALFNQEKYYGEEELAKKYLENL
jgi:hypothetical protein